jgi:extracellular factor (EF) 3-hydroxypalmitic acid methyl ester biosynthesis protein
METNCDFTQLISGLDSLLEQNGPVPDDYMTLMGAVEEIGSSDISAFREKMKPILTPDTIIGFSFSKPMGYNGDFFIIEKIYQHYVNPDQRFSRWDEFFHQLPAAMAVVNRKVLATRILKKLNKTGLPARKDVLILGSGPAREVNEYFQSTTENHLYFDLIDLDPRAISYATNRNKPYLEFLEFHHNNVIRFQPAKQYNLIWSAGLFDYFRDKHFVYLIKKYYEALKPGGRLIIGNFGSNNPSRKIMEVLGDWFLYHRSDEELIQFAKQADVPANEVKVIAEPLGINLFLTISKRG